MKEIIADIWDVYDQYDAVCITTNGTVKKDGSAVMGAGIANQFKYKYKGIDRILGKSIKRGVGNHVAPLITINNTLVVSFPVKHNWQDIADIELILRSYTELVNFINFSNLNSVLLPKPGCGNGNLNWRMVKFRLMPIWDDRVTIIGW